MHNRHDFLKTTAVAASVLAMCSVPRVAVVTTHPMSNEHFIVRQTLVLVNGTSRGSKTFTPADKPESSYELPADCKGKFYVRSFCNLLDF